MSEQMTVPGYVECTVIVDGADDGGIDFDFTQGKEMEAWLDREKETAMRHPERRTEIYLMQHDHEHMDGDCACAQYLTDHHPYWSFGKLPPMPHEYIAP